MCKAEKISGDYGAVDFLLIPLLKWPLKALLSLISKNKNSPNYIICSDYSHKIYYYFLPISLIKCSSAVSLASTLLILNLQLQGSSN